MANVHFLRKITQDELWDTVFFASGEVPLRTKSNTGIKLETALFKVNIISNRNISINGTRCTSIPDAKYFIQQHIGRCCT